MKPCGDGWGSIANGFSVGSACTFAITLVLHPALCYNLVKGEGGSLIRNKRKLRLIFSVIVCFLLGAAPWVVGLHFEWEIFEILLATVAAGGIATTAFLKINKIKKDENEN